MDVLTEEKRSDVRYGMRMMRRGMSPGSGMMQGMMGGQDGGKDGTGRMGAAGMMQMMAAMHAGMHRQDGPLHPDEAEGN